MANWARTDYRIEGNQEDLQEIYYLCKAFDNGERPVMEDGASKDWEGNIILALGIEKGESYLRGFIQSCELSDGSFASRQRRLGVQQISDIFLKNTIMV